MRKLLTGLAVGALVTGAPAAADHPRDWYAGGCALSTANDTTPNRALGGEETWRGVVDLLVRTDDGNAPVTPTADAVYVRCDLDKNGALFRYGVIEASGTGVAVRAAPIEFEAAAADVVTVCTYVEVGGDPDKTSYHCEETTATVPERDPMDDVEAVIGMLNDDVFARTDPVVCPLLAARAGSHGPVTIDGEGDVYLLGSGYESLWWDCPPYEAPPA